jgi:signal transduction histidine kinase
VAFLFCATFTVGIALAFVITYFEISYSLEKSDKEVIASRLHEASVILNRDGVSGLEKFLGVEKNRITNAPFWVRVLTPSGDVAFDKPSVQAKKFDFAGSFGIRTEPHSVLGWTSLSAIDDEDKFEILTEANGPNYYLQVGKSSEDREDILDHISEIFASTGVVLLLLGGALIFWYALGVLKPLRNFVSAIQEIEGGDLARRVQLGGVKDELHELGEIFNRMITRIESLVRIMRESLDHVAHDIRTPLTRIKAVAEDALISDQPTSLREALEDCAENTMDISGMVDQLMSLSEAEAGTLALKLEVCEVDLLLKDVLEIYEFVALEKSIAMELDIRPALKWKLDRKRIKQAVANLIDNALKFSDAKSRIRLEAHVAKHTLKISVTDEGHGIAPEDLPRIWDRLFRGDRSRSTKGSGLGLSIVRAIVMAHRGEVMAVSDAERGTTFSMTLP